VDDFWVRLLPTFLWNNFHASSGAKQLSSISSFTFIFLQTSSCRVVNNTFHPFSCVISGTLILFRSTSLHKSSNNNTNLFLLRILYLSIAFSFSVYCQYSLPNPSISPICSWILSIWQIFRHHNPNHNIKSISWIKVLIWGRVVILPTPPIP